jgi:hypothetical protein
MNANSTNTLEVKVNLVPSLGFAVKVFGIGLSKTGTRSLAGALEILGYRTIHYPPLDGIPDIFSKYDAATDTSVACCYEQLDKLFPKSKFILTIRDVKTWLVSCERQFRGKPVPEGWRHEVRLRLYGTAEWNAEKFAASCEEHIKKVQLYFQNRPLDLLTMNIVSGDGWEKLCTFLGKKVPVEPFPHRNRTGFAEARKG